MIIQIVYAVTCLTLVGKGIPYLAGQMTTYYFRDPEEALRRAKAAGRQPGCWFGGITLPSGKRGWAVYRAGKVVEQYAVMATHMEISHQCR